MTHLPNILASYAFGIGVPLVFGIAAWRRMRAATRKLAALDQRARS